MTIIDTSTEGHHKIYQNTLLKLADIKLKLIEKKLNLRKMKIRYFLELYKIINIEKNDDIHFLNLDVIYKYPLCFRLNKKRKVIGTLHKVPNNFFKMLLLKNFSKKITSVIVHSEYMKEILNLKKIVNVEVVEYPSFYEYKNIDKKEVIRGKKKISDKKIVISALGGTREDKGLDILLESFKYLNEEIKNKILLNISGNEEKFKRDFIELKLKENKINSRTNYNFLTDKEFMEEVLITDIMMMPYKKSFSGSSGPMIEAIANGIPCITPKTLEIGCLTEKYGLGLTFECENEKDLANTIKKIIENIEKFKNNNYKNEIGINNFLNKYKKLYD